MATVPKHYISSGVSVLIAGYILSGCEAGSGADPAASTATSQDKPEVATFVKTAEPIRSEKPSREPIRVHNLKIGVFADGIISEDSASAVLTSLNEMLTEAGGVCEQVRFAITRGPEKFDSSIPSYVGNGNFRSFSESPFSINVVSQILECGSWVVNRGQSFGGCTTLGSFPVTVVPSTAAKRWILWMHELGHSQGLQDRCSDRDSGCSTDLGWAMSGRLEVGNTKISQQECLALYRPQQFPIILANESVASDEQGETLSLLEGSWNHAMPVVQLLALDELEKDTVREYIQSRRSGGLANAVLALGLVGEITDLDTIVSVLSEDILLSSGEIDFDVVDAKLNVPISLGYLSSRTGSMEPTRVLRQLSAPPANLRYFSEFDSGGATLEYATALWRNVAVGAALSGTEDGAELLSTLTQSTNMSFGARLSDEFASKLSGLHQRSDEQGVVNLLLEGDGAMDN